jgi:hypothetical protein
MGDKVWPKDVAWARADEIYNRLQHLKENISTHIQRYESRMAKGDFYAMEGMLINVQSIVNDLYIASHEGGHDTEFSSEDAADCEAFDRLRTPRKE